ncbi:MAG: ankyrin repeat domain-containing protein [Smithella sp.]
MKRFGMFVFALLLTVTLGTGICLADINEDLYKAISAKDIQKVKELISNGANINARWKNIIGGYISALDHAVSSGAPDIAIFLIDKGADVNYSIGGGDTVLMDAAWQGFSDVVELLLKKGANPNAKEELTGWTALMDAAMAGRTQTAKMLLNNGANVDLADKDGQTALHLAMVISCHPETVSLLLMKGANANAKTGNGRTPLMYAVTCPNEINVLLKSGADVNAKDSRGFTTLMFAAKQDQIGTAKLLIAGGADINAKSSNGSTALSIAEANDMIIFLRQAGANGDKMPVQISSALSTADIKFLTDECLIDRSDIDAIPKLEKSVKELLFTRITRRDCKSLAYFKSSRAYFKTLLLRKKGDDFPMPPAGWGIEYLTNDEIKLYEKALEAW